jgi:hypothetical protein
MKFQSTQPHQPTHTAPNQQHWDLVRTFETKGEKMEDRSGEVKVSQTYKEQDEKIKIPRSKATPQK